jgi:hypothetical protein
VRLRDHKYGAAALLVVLNAPATLTPAAASQTLDRSKYGF